MKKLIALGLLCASLFVQAQLVEPVKWKAEVKRLDDDQLALFIRASLDSGWHIYSLHLPEGGPVKTTIKLTGGDKKEVTLLQWVEMGEKEQHFDSSFGINVTYFSHKAVFAAKLPATTAQDSGTVTVNYMICNNEFCLPPADQTLSFSLRNASSFAKATTTEIKAFGGASLSVAENSGPEKSGRSLWIIFFTAFLGGLAALLTPCVFPMIPLTVSFFTKRSATRTKGITHAFTYGASIIIIYLALGSGVTMLFGIDALNSLATNVWVNLLFFVLLVVFGVSFIGAFNIQLPASWATKMDAQSGRGGLLGIFFMALTLAVVSFSCTGPIIGTLLFESAVSGNLKDPLIGMTGFSLALALPFGLFAAFPHWMKSLPKSGSWMNSVKVVLGFLELALALKFLSNADLVLQAGLLSRELFLALWVAIFSLLFLYLVGIIRFPHDNPEQQQISVGRGMLATVTLAFTLYLLPGLWGAPLKLISGFPPPDFYKEWQQPLMTTAAANENAGAATHSSACPNDLPCFHDYNEAFAYARKENKPLLLDFTGWACVNCRKMEANVWTNAEVDKRLRNDVVLVSLYVDDKRELPKEEQTTKMLGNRKVSIKTIGNKWSYFQAERFHINSQPYYVLLDGNENTLAVFEGYHPSSEAYLRFLEQGIAQYRNQTIAKK